MLALSNDGLILAVRTLVKEERRITREILDHINEVSRRRLYADLGFSSIFEWLVKDLGYSESAGKIASGELSLTVLSKVQTMIRADEKRNGEKMTPQESRQGASIAKRHQCESQKMEVGSHPKCSVPKGLKPMCVS